MANHPIYGDLNDANNLARYNEDRETLKAGDDAEKGIGELSGKSNDALMKSWNMARKNPLMALFGAASVSEQELGGIGKSLSAIDAADQIRQQLAQARQQQQQQQNASPPPSPPPPP